MDETTYDILVNELGMTPEQIDALMELGVLQGDIGTLDRQLAQAEQLRATPDARGRYAGRTFVAANPLEHVATGLDRIRGERDIARDPRRRRDIAEEQARLRALYLGAGGQRRRPSPVNLPPPITGYGPQ